MDEEGVKVLAEGGMVKEIGKAPKKGLRCVGESVGMVRLSDAGRKTLLKTMDSHIERGDIDFEWEHVLNESLEGIKLKYSSAGDRKWVEIDFEADVRKARQILKP